MPNADSIREELDRLQRRIDKVRGMLAKTETRDVSPECQAAYDIAVAASAATTAANAAYQALLIIDQAAWWAYWDCESP